MNERERVALLARVLGDPGSGVTVGIGDDAAVLARPSSEVVLSVDAMVEGVHFTRAMLSFRGIGYRATMGALSDLAAMGARPLGVLSSLILPADVDDAALEALAEGQAEACRVAKTAVIGGNLARGEELSVTTTVVGVAAAPRRRDGAMPGHGIWAAGPIGLAGCGLRVLLEMPERASEGPLAPAVEAWRRPRARIAEGLDVAARLSAAIDVSDGLALDLSRMAEASGCAILLEAEALRESALVAAAEVIGADPVERALHGGEDYALVVASADDALPGFRRLGVCEQGDGLWVARSGERERVQADGWDHFE